MWFLFEVYNDRQLKHSDFNIIFFISWTLSYWHLYRERDCHGSMSQPDWLTSDGLVDVENVHQVNDSVLHSVSVIQMKYFKRSGFHFC